VTLPGPTALSLVALVVLSGCTYRRDGLQRLEGKIGGPTAVDCGGVRPGESPRAIDRCAVEAFRSGRPFIARYYNESIDSIMAIVLIRAPDGRAFRVYYDSAPCGGPGCPERLVQRPCERPHVVAIEGGERVTCE
jgi:hypothetical protein